MLRLAARAGRPLARGFRSSAAVFADEAAAADAKHVTLNFSCPHQPIHQGAEVAMVTIPGVAGDYGVTPGHSAVVSELKAGVVEILHDASGEPEKYFVSSGFAVTHANSTTDILAVEAAALDDIDGDAARSGLADFRAAFDKAAPDTVERAQAQIGVEVHEAMCSALGLATN